MIGIEEINYYINKLLILSRSSSDKLIRSSLLVTDWGTIISGNYSKLPNKLLQNKVDDESYPNKYFLSSIMLTVVDSLTKSPELNLNHCILFTTHVPTIEDIKLLYRVGIKRVMYLYNEDNDREIDFLNQLDFDVRRLDI